MVFRSPKYYAELRKFRKEQELRKRNKLAESRQPVVGGQQQSDQSISSSPDGNQVERSTGPGLKLQATSNKPQAPSESSNKLQASSPKQKGSSFKPQASSAKIPEPGNN